MTDNLSVIIGILVIVAPIILLIWFAISLQRKQRMKAWGNYFAIADALNITPPVLTDREMKTKMPFLSGRSKGRDFILKMEVKGSGKSRTYYNTFMWTIALPQEKLLLSLYKENFFTRLGSIVGLKDIKTGFESFDKKFILICNNQNFASSLFTNEICNVMEDVHDAFHTTLHLSSIQIFYSEPGMLTNDASRDRILKLILASRTLADKAEKGVGMRG